MKAVVLGCAAVTLILIGVSAIAWSILAGHRLSCLPRVIACRARRAILLTRWAWRCRNAPPLRSRVRLEEWEQNAFRAIRRGRKRTARPERTRT